MEPRPQRTTPAAWKMQAGWASVCCRRRATKKWVVKVVGGQEEGQSGGWRGQEGKWGKVWGAGVRVG